MDAGAACRNLEPGMKNLPGLVVFTLAMVVFGVGYGSEEGWLEGLALFVGGEVAMVLLLYSDRLDAWFRELRGGGAGRGRTCNGD